MADETDAADKRAPHAPVIDLEAESIEDAPLPRDEKPAPAPRKRRWALWGIGALALAAALAGGWLYRSYGISIWPTDAMVDLASRVATVESAAKTAGDQVKGLGASLDQLRADAAGLKAAVDAATGDSKAARTDAAASLAVLAALNDRLAAAETRLKEALAAIESAGPGGPGGAPVVTAPADAAKLKELETRLAALEADVAAAKTAGPPEPDEDTIRILSQTLAGLEAKVAAGAPYTEELSVLARLVPAAPGLDALSATAASGLATPAALATQLAALIPALPGPPEAADDGEGGNWFTSLFDGVVTIRDLGETDWRAAAEAARAKTASGDLPGAISGLAAAEGDMPPALAAWLAAAKGRVAGDAALAQVSAAVLRHVAALGGTP